MESYSIIADGKNIGGTEVDQSLPTIQYSPLDAFIGYAVISLMGLCLGMIGAGGSLLAVPVLVYLFRVEPTLATSYATIVVGATAGAGAIRSLSNKTVDLRSVIWFGMPCILAAYLARFCLVSVVPANMVSLTNFTLTRNGFVMVLFSLTMLLAGCSMLVQSDRRPLRLPGGWLIPVGCLVGMVTGIVGAGGGFLILPSLILFAGLEVSVAVGTSLTIITIKSIASLSGDLSAGLHVDWMLIATLAAAAIPGVILGRSLNGRVKAATLKNAFGVMMCVAGCMIAAQQIVSVVRGD